jgi:lipopolysaccharide transport system permease protein
VDAELERALAALPVTVIRPRRGWLGLGLGEVWAYRELLGFLVWRDVKVRYKQTVLGVLWAILQPFLTMVVFAVFFHRFAGIGPEGGKVPYALWSYAGLLPWTYFAQALARSSNSLVAGRSLVTRVYFPRLVMPLAGVLSALVDFAVASTVYAGMLVWHLVRHHGVRPGVELAYLPAFVVFAAAAALAVGLWLSALNVRYRDVRHTIPFLIQLWLFLSPVVYPASKVPAKWRVYYGLNPMAGVVEGFRWCLLGKGAPPETLSTDMLWVSVAATAVVLVTGALYFRRSERTFADVV